MAVGFRVTRIALLVLGVAACRSASTADREDGLPEPRSGAIDTARVSSIQRASGFSAFVHLTGPPTPQALATLDTAGLRPPQGRSSLVVFEALALNVVWGDVPAGGLDRIAAVGFVTRVEPATDSVGIGP